jgi:leader peptidase (prepilin peptidase)/N-methyltransferase
MFMNNEMWPLWAVAGAVFGLIFGSAINAMVWRLKEEKSWVKGRSVCSVCGHVLEPQDLVPVVSYLMLRGKCRYCKKPIQDKPIVELVTAAVFAVSAVVLAPSSLVEGVRLAFWVVMLVMLIVLAVYDARWMLLPNKVMWPLIAVAGLYAVTMAVLTQSPQVVLGALAAAGLAGGGFWLLVAGTRGRAMGGGDIKLAFAMGLMLGLQGTAVAMLVAFNVGAIVGIIMIVTKKKTRKDHIPFGPYLIGGAIFAFWFARPVAEWYLRLNGF